jgi:large subunit ribosomal protein L18
MIQRLSKNKVRVRVHRRIRRKVHGATARPRLCVFRSLKHIYAQVIDDSQGTTLVSASSADQAAGLSGGGNVATAKAVGRLVAERAKAKGIGKVVFDRGGYLYHGRVKALAEAAREAGLEF